MKNKYKTKKQLIEELEALQKQAEKLKKTETRAKQAGKPSLAAQYWQTMFDAINNAVSIIDRNGKITQCNKAMASLLQKPTSEIIGHTCWELLHSSTKPIPECPIVRMKKSLKRETLTLPLIGRWFEITADPIIDKRGKLAGAVHIIADINERKRVEAALWESEQKYRTLVEQSLQGLVIAQGHPPRLVFANPAMANILGYTTDELTSLSPQETEGLVHPEDRTVFFKRFRERLEGKMVLPHYEVRAIRKDRAACWLEIYASRIEYQGQPAVQAAFVDITERKTIEEELNAERFKLREFFNNLPTLAYTISLDGKIMDCNPVAIMTLGYKSKEDLIGKALVDTIYAPSSHQKASQLFERWKKEGKLKNEEMQIITKQGKILDVLLNVDTIYDMNGNPLYSISTQLDITERKQAEEEYKTILRTAMDGFSIDDMQGRILDVNDAYCRLMGYSRDEMLTMRISDVEAVERQGETAQRIKKIMEVGGDRFETRHRCKDGRIVDVEISVNYLDAGGGRLFVFVRDITERKRAEESLRESEERLKLAAKSADVGLFDWDLRTNKVFFSLEWKRQIGYEDHEISNDFSEWQSRVHPDDLEMMLKTVNDYIRNPWPNYEIEFRFRHKDGSYRWILTKASLLIDAEGKPYRMLGSHIDITERKQAEEELRKFKTIADRAGYGVAMSDLEGNLLYVNESFANMHGYTAEELIGRNLSVFHNEEQMENVDRLTKTLQEMGSYITEEVWHMRKDGAFFPTLMHGTLVRGVKGEPLFMATTAIDITKQKQAEGALQFTRFSLDNATDAMICVGRDARFIDVNDACCRSWGYSREELLSMSVHDIDPDYSAEIWPEFWEKLKQSGSLTFESYHRTKEGKVYPVEIVATFFEYNGKEYHCSFARDITERKLAEEALRESEEKYKTLTESSLTGIFIHQDGRFVFVNEKFAEIHGYKLDELIGEDHLKLIHPDEREDLKEIALKRLDGETVPQRYEVRRIKKNGETIWCEIMVTRIYYKGRPAIMGNIIDITDRKRMGEELKRSHEMKIFGQLAAGVAHEVRNPLNAILAITEALFQDIGDNPEYLPYLEHIQNQVNRLSILMKDLLEIGKPISHDSFQPETVAGIVTSTIDLWGMLDLSKKYSLRYISHPESEKLYVKTEIARFQQVVLNLLQNAAQNSPEGSEIVIQVLEPGDKTVNIHIIDRGTGIPHDNLLYVFEPFFTTQKGGTGLGLSIVKHFVESMGGNVAIWNNDPPPGCTVELRLPIATDSES